MATSGNAVASTSLSPLDALSPDSAPLGPSGAGRIDAQDEAQAAGDVEPIPTLASLLLSTAESLASRSTSSSSPANPAAPVRPAAGKQPAKPSFTLSTSPQALLNHPAAPPYLSSLLAQPLSALQSLPTSLATLSTSLDNDLSSLAFTRYSSFLLSYTAAQSISTSFTTLSDSLSALLDSTSALEAAASSFETRVHTVREKRERMARVRERVEEVEELLEAPSVVDACVRAGHWSEAIDVAVRLEDLHKRLAKTVSSDPEGEGTGALRLVNRVRTEVGVALLSLRARVLESLLHRSLKLPGAVRGIGILRRIAERGVGAGDAGDAAAKPTGKRKELDEDALRVVFLVARWRCLRTELESVEAQMAASGIQLAGAEPPLAQQDANVTVEENDERMRWTKRWIEVWREVVGDTVSMFAEVFLASSSLHPLGGATSAPTEVDLAIPAHALAPSAPLHLFLSTALNSLASVLTRAIAGLNSTASLSSLLTQLTYCSHSFARYGLDFRDWIQLRERIELRIGRIVAAEWETAGRKWEREWRDGWENSGGTATTAAKARRAGRVPLSDWLVAPEGVASLLSTPTPDAAPSATVPADWHHQPSPSLALLPPIARFLNAHATALNALRLIPPVSLYLPLRRAQAVELDRATQVLAAFIDAWLASLNASPLPPQSASRQAGPTTSATRSRRSSPSATRSAASSLAPLRGSAALSSHGAKARSTRASTPSWGRADAGLLRRPRARRASRTLSSGARRSWRGSRGGSLKRRRMRVGRSRPSTARATSGLSSPSSTRQRCRARRPQRHRRPLPSTTRTNRRRSSLRRCSTGRPSLSTSPCPTPVEAPVPTMNGKGAAANEEVQDPDAPYMVDGTAPLPPAHADTADERDEKALPAAGAQGQNGIEAAGAL